MTAFTIQAKEFDLFPTKVITLQFAEIDRMNREIFQFWSTHGPYQEPDYFKKGDSSNLLDMVNDCPALQQLQDMFLVGLGNWFKSRNITGDFQPGMYMFSNFAKPGDYTLVHNHRDAQIVAVYYVKVPPSPVVGLKDDEKMEEYWSRENGVLVLHDPRFNSNLAEPVRMSSYKKIYPCPGLMVVFPGYLWHSVTPNTENERRLSITANFNFHFRDEAVFRAVPFTVSRP